jgi:hypothetical protein
MYHEDGGKKETASHESNLQRPFAAIHHGDGRRVWGVSQVIFQITADFDLFAIVVAMEGKTAKFDI